MKLLYPALILSALTAIPVNTAEARAPSPAFERTAPWNAETSDMESDSRIIYGRLNNGLRYAIRPNKKPESQVLVRMVVDFGSAAEADDEQGLAHFIEHMAFNGSTHVPEGEMVRMLERLGLSFGADTNASTGYLKTTYMLDLPRTEPALLERALFLMRESASEISFNPAAVDRERGVVLSEMRDGENFRFRSMRESFRLLYPDSFYSKRMPIGQREVLEKASAEKMKALYQKWYTPDRTKLIIVGPVDPAKIEQEIARKFADWGGSGAALGDLKQCSFDTDRAAGSAIFAHPEIEEQLNIEQMVPDRKRADNMESALLTLRMGMAWGIISDRLRRRTRKEETPFLYAGPSFEPGFCDKYARLGFTVGGKDGSWREILPLVEQTVRQAAAYGFTQAEMTEQLKRYDANYANAVRNEPTVGSGAFANALAGLDNEIISSAEYQRLAWLQLRPFITAHSVAQEFSGWFNKLDRPQIYLSTRKGDGLQPADLQAAFQQSRGVAVSPPAERQTAAWAYTDFGPKGVVAKDSRIDDLSIRTIRFENGVLLNIKKTDFEANRAHVSMRIDGGWMLFGKDAIASLAVMNGAFIGGGLGQHEIDDIRALTAGSTASANLGVTDDHFTSTGNVVTKDLELQLQLMAAYVTDPAYRDEAVRLFKRGMPEYYARFDATPGSAMAHKASGILHDNDPRFTDQPLEKLLAADFDGIKKLIGDSLKTNRLEIGVVGDIDEAIVIDLVSRTFGALPKRNSETLVAETARTVQYSKNTGTHDFYHRGEANQMAWRRMWITTDSRDQKRTQTMEILADIFQIRLLDELREKLGAAYGAGASSNMSSSYRERGQFTLSTNGDPKNIAAIEAAVDAVVAELTAKAVDQDLFDRARKPTLERYRDWRKFNSTWIGVVAEAQTDAERLKKFRDSEASFKSITADDVLRAAQFYIKDKPSFTFRALPKATASETAVTAP